MAPKKDETTLTDINETLKRIEKLLSGRVEIAAPAPKKDEPAAPESPADDNEVPKFLRDYMEKHPEAKTADLIREFKVSQNKALAAVKQFGKKAAPPKEEKPKAEKVTVEVLRETISKFAEKFGMNEALRINEQFGGSRKVSGIPEEKYEAVHNEMISKLKVGAEEDPKAEAPTVTKEDIQKAGSAFIGKYGDPAFRELLSKYVAKGAESKISQVDPSKYPALHEALVNA